MAWVKNECFQPEHHTCKRCDAKLYHDEDYVCGDCSDEIDQEEEESE